MGCWFIIDDHREGAARRGVFYDSVSETAFGPGFSGYQDMSIETEMEEFCVWLDQQREIPDPRHCSTEELVKLRDEWHDSLGPELDVVR